MNPIDRIKPSATLANHFDGNHQAAWPAILPRYTYQVAPLWILPPGHAQRQILKEVSHRNALEGLAKLSGQADGPSPNRWSQTLIAMAAALKLGDSTQAIALAAKLPTLPGFEQSLEVPPLGTSAELMAAHFLWLVMHVAIEEGEAVQMWPVLSNLGLQTRVAQEPHLASGLLVNAICLGDVAAVQMFIAHGLHLTPEAQTGLTQEAQTMMTKLLKDAPKIVDDERLAVGLPLLQACFRAAGLSEQIFTPMIIASAPATPFQRFKFYGSARLPGYHPTLMLVAPKTPLRTQSGMGSHFAK
jgi:hypothetical protein